MNTRSNYVSPRSSSVARTRRLCGVATYERGLTLRRHTLAYLFSCLTGNPSRDFQEITPSWHNRSARVFHFVILEWPSNAYREERNRIFIRKDSPIGPLKESISLSTSIGILRWFYADLQCTHLPRNSVLWHVCGKFYRIEIQIRIKSCRTGVVQLEWI